MIYIITFNLLSWFLLYKSPCDFLSLECIGLHNESESGTCTWLINTDTKVKLMDLNRLAEVDCSRKVIPCCSLLYIYIVWWFARQMFRYVLIHIGTCSSLQNGVSKRFGKTFWVRLIIATVSWAQFAQNVLGRLRYGGPEGTQPVVNIGPPYSGHDPLSQRHTRTTFWGHRVRMFVL